MPDIEFLYTIPSYNRANRQITVHYLNEIGINKERIYVFVQTEEDKRKYEEIIGTKATLILRKASRGVEARNNILNALSNSYNLMMFDDDIRAIGELKGGKIEKIADGQRMDALFSKCFNMCNKTKTDIFGIYPVYNEFFMEGTISTKSPINTVFGFAKGFKERYNENYDTKEDAEMCARILFKGKNILRFNFLAVDADHRKTKDGYIDDWHQEENIRCVKRLLVDYPTIYEAQKNKPWEVRSIIKDKKIKLEGGKKR